MCSVGTTGAFTFNQKQHLNGAAVFLLLLLPPAAAAAACCWLQVVSYLKQQHLEVHTRTGKPYK
jgi:hypothetical protein